MVDQSDKQRAWLPDSRTIDARRLETAHRRLQQLLRKEMRVLDIGCGTGAITSGIAEHVGVGGSVIGIDYNPAFIALASEQYKDRENLAFHCASVYALPDVGTFDLVTAARVIQWLSDPPAAIQAMTRMLGPGGKLLILDYNHLRLQFDPEPPLLVQRFYQRFLDWRADAGYCNDTADQLSQWLADAGLDQIVVTAQSEQSERANPATRDGMRIWAEVMRIRGPQMVADHYWQAADLPLVEQTYLDWLEEEAQSMTLYLLAAEGIRNK